MLLRLTATHSVRKVARGLVRQVADLPLQQFNMSTTRLKTLAPSDGWLWNDQLQRRLRTVQVNMDAVTDLACQKMSATRCVSVDRLGEGSYNIAYNLTLDNGIEMVARFPSRLVGNVHLTTASEVATMEYFREVIGKPAPKVYAWSSDPQLTRRVGSDFILMEKIDGDSLVNHWLNLSTEQAAAIIGHIIVNHNRIMTPKFSQIGSIYFKQDLPTHLQERPLYQANSSELPGGHKFRIGPITDREFWYNGELEVQDLCGPWPDVASLLWDVCRLALRRAEF